eukprot:13556018-Ditylum_brightwellii.AAC.1
MVKTYAVIYGQCTEAMQLEIKSDPEYELQSVKKNPEGGETLDSFRKRIRIVIDNLSLAGGDGVLQPNMTGTGL